MGFTQSRWGLAEPRALRELILFLHPLRPWVAAKGRQAELVGMAGLVAVVVIKMAVFTVMVLQGRATTAVTVKLVTTILVAVAVARVG